MREETFRKIINYNYEVTLSIIDEYCHNCSDEDFAKIPTVIMSQEEKNVFEKYGLVMWPIRDKVNYKSNEDDKCYSLGLSPIKIKTHDQ